MKFPLTCLCNNNTVTAYITGIVCDYLTKMFMLFTHKEHRYSQLLTNGIDVYICSPITDHQYLTNARTHTRTHARAHTHTHTHTHV